MKKISIILISLISVLNIWGQPKDFNFIKMNENNEFNIENVHSNINRIRLFQADVVDMAKMADDSKISKDEKESADSILTTTFDLLQAIVDDYKKFEKDSVLRSEAQNLIREFWNAYLTAISNDSITSISITTKTFLNVAKEYENRFRVFHSKVEEYIVKHPVKQPDEEQKVEDKETTKAVKATEISEESTPWWAWAGLALGLICFVLCVTSSIALAKTNRRITEKLDELCTMNATLSQKISEAKDTYSRNITEVHNVPAKQQIQTPKPQQRTIQVTKQKPKEKPIIQPMVEELPTKLCFYGVAKATPGCNEFYKLDSDNSNDKVFLLTLEKPDDVIAEFTIVPDMSADFRKTVINDRDTYLPTLFCEKAIESSNPQNIIVASPGKAKKVGDNWQVQDRMSIRII